MASESNYSAKATLQAILRSWTTKTWSRYMANKCNAHAALERKVSFKRNIPAGQGEAVHTHTHKHFLQHHQAIPNVKAIKRRGAETPLTFLMDSTS